MANKSILQQGHYSSKALTVIMKDSVHLGMGIRAGLFFSKKVLSGCMQDWQQSAPVKRLMHNSVCAVLAVPKPTPHLYLLTRYADTRQVAGKLLQAPCHHRLDVDKLLSVQVAAADSKAKGGGPEPLRAHSRVTGQR